MRSIISCSLFLAITTRLAHAQSYCDASIGYVISDDASDPGSTYTPSSDCDAECQLYYNEQQTEYSNYFNDAVTSGGNSFLSAAGGKRDLEHTNSILARQSDSYLTCTAAQTCFVYENIPLCIDMETGDFTDPSGGYGNVLTQTYTAAVDTGTNTDTDETTSTSSGSGSGGSSSSGGSSGGGSSSSNSSPNAAPAALARGTILATVIVSAAFAILAT